MSTLSQNEKKALLGANTTKGKAADDGTTLPALATVEEAARYLRVGRSACYELVRQGLPHVRLGKLIRIPRTQLMTWLERQSAGGTNTGASEEV